MIATMSSKSRLGSDPLTRQLSQNDSKDPTSRLLRSSLETYQESSPTNGEPESVVCESGAQRGGKGSPPCRNRLVEEAFCKFLVRREELQV